MFKKIKAKLSRKEKGKEKAVTATTKSTPQASAPVAGNDNVQMPIDELMKRLGLNDNHGIPNTSLPNFKPRTEEQIVQDSVNNVMKMMTAAGAFNKPVRDVEVELDLDDLAPYSYNPLPTPTSIRLLEFSTRDIEFVNLVPSQKSCRLVTYELDEAPPYLCLSYTWGSPVDTIEFRAVYAELHTWVLAAEAADGSSEGSEKDWRKIQIGANLYRAMLNLFKPKSSISHIWIDALCINQMDLAERADQVKIMTEIYAKCERTVVWLGEGALIARDLAAFYLLHVQVLPPLMQWVEKHGIESFSEGWTEHSFYERLGLNARHIDWKNYTKFYAQRTFFNRTWVYQEIAFPKDLLIRVDHHTLKLEEMALLARFLRMSGLGMGLSMGGTEVDSDDGFEDIFRMSKQYSAVEDPNSTEADVSPGAQVDTFYRLRTQVKGIGTMEWLTGQAEERKMKDLKVAAYTFFMSVLCALRLADASDPSDKIFAAQGFLKQALRPLGLEPEIIPDYVKITTEVYIETTSLLLSILPDFAILSECQPADLVKVEGLPSWVPDFSAQQYQSLYHTGHFNNYNAGILPPEVRTSIDPALFTISKAGPSPTLTLHSTYNLDTVTHLAAPFPQDLDMSDPKDAATWQHGVIQDWIQLMGHLRPSVLAQKNKFHDWQTLYSTLLANRGTSEGQKPVRPHNFKAHILSYLYSYSGTFPFIMFPGFSPQTATVAQIEAGKVHWDATQALYDHDSQLYPELIPSAAELHEYHEAYARCETAFSPANEDLDMIHEWDMNGTIFAEAWARLQNCRSLFVTQGGRMGLGPRDMKYSDRVIVVKGSRMVYVIREVGGSGIEKRWRLIGEAYLHGVMNGEMLEKIDRRGWSPIVLV
ncbi:hypothetical protein IQ07DRAFT_596737 [Pyrenochaeta sp. DS3sAY3a]|nr:hypothetical protein IQ07DRAFT_596737 [Pyrenochaeta sp. DS3sAY3a]